MPETNCTLSKENDSKKKFTNNTAARKRLVKYVVTCISAYIVQLLRDKIVRFLIKASNLAGLLTAMRQIFPDMEPCQICFQNHGMHMSKIWHTRPLHGKEARAKYRFFGLLGLLCLVYCFF